jgi:hypothetical protein
MMHEFRSDQFQSVESPVAGWAAPGSRRPAPAGPAQSPPPRPQLHGEIVRFALAKAPLGRADHHQLSIGVDGAVTFTSAVMLSQPWTTGPGALYAVVDLAAPESVPPVPLRDLPRVISLAVRNRRPTLAFVFTQPQTLRHAKFNLRQATMLRRREVDAGRVRADVILVDPTAKAAAVAQLVTAGIPVRAGLNQVLAEGRAVARSSAEVDEVTRRDVARQRTVKQCRYLSWVSVAALLAIRVVLPASPILIGVAGVVFAVAYWQTLVRKRSLTAHLRA